MRKLVLASFSFKTGEIRFDEQRLIVIEIAPNQKEHLEAISARFKRWFHAVYPSSELLGIVPYTSIDFTGPDEAASEYDEGRQSELGRFDYLAHPLSEVPVYYQGDISRQMVIDMNGKREHFQIGFYDFDENDWMFMEDDTSMLERENAKWMDILPFSDR